MKKQLFAAGVFFLLLLAAFTGEAGSKPKSFILLPHDSLNLALVKEHIGGPVKITGGWTPDSIIIRHAFLVLADWVKTWDTYPEAPMPLADYDFQLVGYTDKKGNRYIFMNGCCRTKGAYDWEKELYFVRGEGGGGCYYQAVYGLTERDITEDHINADL